MYMDVTKQGRKAFITNSGKLGKGQYMEKDCRTTHGLKQNSGCVLGQPGRSGAAIRD